MNQSWIFLKIKPILCKVGGRINGSETNLWQTKRKLFNKGKKRTSGNPNTTQTQIHINA